MQANPKPRKAASPAKATPAPAAKATLPRPLFAPLPHGRFAIFYADPPWDYKGQLQHSGAGSPDTGGAVRHYASITLDDLKQLPVQLAAEEDSLLFMWATSPHLDQAIDLGKAWGFAWATVAFVWDKGRVNPGFYTLSRCELCLVFKRGRIPHPRGSRKEHQLVSAARGPHSAKPGQVRDSIARMFPAQKKLELFARQPAKGWQAWGLESNGTQARTEQAEKTETTEKTEKTDDSDSA